MRVRDLNWMQVERYLERDDRVVLPVGSTEQHAYLSLETDNVIAERLAIEAAEPLGIPVLPVLAYGVARSTHAPNARALFELGLMRDRPAGAFLGTMGERMLRLAAAHADGWNAWFAWFGNRPEGLAELRTKVDRACADVGRDPATLERSVALLIRIQPGESSRRGGPEEVVEPLQGSPDELAAALTRFADEGIGHVQLVLDPITLGSIERMGAVLEALDRVGSGSGGSNP